MRHSTTRWLALSVLSWSIVLTSSVALRADDATSAEIDRTIWEVISRSVVDQDIDAMAATYHPDAVLVSVRGTTPIAEQLVVWGQGMEEQEASGASATVAFRFTTRLHDETTAFEAGMFNYTQIDSDGNESSAYVPFEALLVKKNGTWLMVMERQLPAADEAAWDALPQSPS